MRFWIHHLIVAVSSLAVVMSQTCPSDHFSAVITAIVDQSVDNPLLPIPDPKLTFLKTIMKFRESDIQHVTEDVIRFLNEQHGLDFSNSIPNDQNQCFFQNATMRPFIFPADKINFIVTVNHWVQSGSTHSSCYFMHVGGFVVTFSGEQILYGNYGGAEGKPVGGDHVVVYGFQKIDVCKQSPIIIQFQSETPIIDVNVDETIVSIFDFKLYNQVLGYGQAIGMLRLTPDSDEPGRFHATLHNTMTFPQSE